MQANERARSHTLLFNQAIQWQKYREFNAICLKRKRNGIKLPWIQKCFERYLQIEMHVWVSEGARRVNTGTIDVFHEN